MGTIVWSGSFLKIFTFCIRTHCAGRAGKHCGSRFPERVVSSGQSLWMRFTSDETIQYPGFRAVYRYIRNPKPPIADIGECVFDLSGDEVGKRHFL